jgi:hypothetical protein
MYHTICDAGEPETLREALLGVDQKNWELAMREKYQSLQESKTWDLVDLLEGKKAIS